MSLPLIDERLKRALRHELPLVASALILVLLPTIINSPLLAIVELGGILVIAAIRPRALILAVPFAIPMSFNPFQIGDLQFNILEILALGAVIGYTPRVMNIAWRDRSHRASTLMTRIGSLIPNRGAAAIAGILLLGGIASTIWVADTDYLAESLRTFRWTILLPIAYIIVAAPILNGAETTRLIAAALFVAGALAAALIAIFDGLFGGGIQADAVTRLSGMAPHPNALALVLVRAAVLGLLVGLLSRRRFSPFWLVPSGIIAGVTLLTFSRGAFLGMITGLVLILILARARKIALLATGAATVILGTIVLAAPDRALSLLGGGSGSLRIALWSSSVEMIRDYPLTGVGLDQFLYTYLPRYVLPDAWPERFTSHPHNLILDSWLSLGIIGPVVLVLLLVLTVHHLRDALQVHDGISLGAAGALVTTLVHGMVDQSYFLPELAMSVWLLILLVKPALDRETINHVKVQDS